MGLSPNLMLLLLFAGVLLLLLLVILAFSDDGSAKKGAKRLEKLRERHALSREAMTQAQMKRILAQRENKLDDIFSRFVPQPAELRARLSRTGKDWTLGQYAATCLAIAVGGALLMLSAGLPLLLSMLIGIFLGLALPHVVIGKLADRRAKAFNTRFPDAIDLMVRGLRSGLPVSESLGVVGKEIPDPVGQEFRTISDKIRIGRTMEVALQETANRIRTPEFQFFVITLAIQRETGGNLAETLANLSDVLRKRAQMKLKIKAMSSESKASAFIVGSLPFIVFTLVYLMNPDYLGGFFSDPRLMIAGGGGLLWMSIGAVIMAKMVSFEI